MPKAGRPRKEDPISHVVTVKINNHDYELMVEYARSHNITVSRLIRDGVMIQLNQDKNI